MDDPLNAAAATALELLKAARERSPTAQHASAALALALGRLCARERLPLGPACALAGVAYDAERRVS